LEVSKHTTKVRIKSGDDVIVIAGRDKGTVGRVLRVMPERRKVLVEGVARVRRHMKPTEGRAGAIVDKEMPVDISNVALWDAENGVRVRVGYSVDADGKKQRINRRTGAVLED
jgi:large subunit ribosomal protein L24